MSSEIQTTEFVRKTFSVNAVQITAENMEAVAKYCGGKILHTTPGPDDKVPSAPYIRIYVRKPLNERQTRAYVSDWVLESGGKFKIYPDKSFKQHFELPTSGAQVADEHLSDEDVAATL